MVRNTSNKLWSRGVMAAATVTAAGTGLTGVASAASISNTGPGSYNSISTGFGSGHDGSFVYSVNGWDGKDTRWADDWDNWSPERWERDGKNFDSWYNGCLNWLGQHSQHQYWDGHNDKEWSYGGSSWSSWNPQYFEHKGGSYSDWYNQLMRYMHDNYNNWDQNWSNNWTASYSRDDHKDNHRDDNKHDDKFVFKDDHRDDHRDDHKDNHRDDNKFAFKDDHRDEHKDNDGGRGSGDERDNHVSISNRETTTVNNDTDVRIDNDVRQTAVSGDAESSHNTWGGNVSSGDATNRSENNFEVAVDNSSSTDWALSGRGNGSGNWGSDWNSIHNTGPDSDNHIKFTNNKTTTVNNDTDVNIDNNVSQTAVSGDAESSHNTHGGNVSSGDASNYSSNSFYVSVNN